MTTAKVDNKGQLNRESVSFGEVRWINIENPNDQDIAYLANNYPFHPLDLDDCMSRIQRPKIDTYKDYLFMVFHFPLFNKQARVTAPSQVSAFIGKNYLITLHKGELKPLVKLFRECQIDSESLQENLEQGPAYLLYRIIDRLVDYCLPILNKIHENIEDVEDGIFNPRTRGQIRDISILRRDVIAFRRIIWPMRAALGSMEPKLRRFSEAEMAVYFEDIVDHVDRIWDGLDEYKEIIEGLNDTHDSIATNRTNAVMRALTIVATIFMPITLIASIWGMNIPLPFERSPHALLYICLIMSGIIGGMLYFFRRQHWI